MGILICLTNHSHSFLLSGLTTVCTFSDYNVSNITSQRLQCKSYHIFSKYTELHVRVIGEEHLPRSIPWCNPQLVCHRKQQCDCPLQTISETIVSLNLLFHTKSSNQRLDIILGDLNLLLLKHGAESLHSLANLLIGNHLHHGHEARGSGAVRVDVALLQHEILEGGNLVQNPVVVSDLLDELGLLQSVHELGVGLLLLVESGKSGGKGPDCGSGNSKTSHIAGDGNSCKSEHCALCWSVLCGVEES